MSFPAHVRPEKAKLIAEAGAFGMFQSGEHQDDIWSYVAALHTDRPYPHVHIVVNNRGIAKDCWFYMAREHVFILEVMKERMVAIAAEEGVFLDATSRAERGLLSYGPSRAEIERAREGGRVPEARPREGRALEDALTTLAQSAEAMRSLQHVAALTGLPEIGARIARAEAALRKGGVVHPFPGPGDAATVGRADLERHFSTWMTETRDKIGRLSGAAERRALQDELYGYAIDIAQGHGDARGAQLMRMLPQSALYATAIKGDQLTRGREVTALRPGGADRLRTGIVGKAMAIGLDGERMAKRLDVGAANAWEERDWLRSDLLVLAERNRLDLRHPSESRRVTAHLQGFHDAATGLIDDAMARETVPESDQLLQTLRVMGRTMQTHGSVSFRSDAQAERFAEELRQRHGDGIVTELAAGQTDGLARDVEDPEQRSWIARAIVSAAKSHEAFGLTLREAVQSERKWTASSGREAEKDWER